MSAPPPHEMSEAEYAAIEAAICETARGRRFLTEFARRNRMAETRQLLDAMARLEAAVAGGKTAIPSASVRLLAQRVAEVSQRLGDIAEEMRESGVEVHFTAAVAAQARAVSGLMRAAPPAGGSKPPALQAEPRAAALRLPPTDPLPARDTEPAAAPPAKDARLAALASLDALTLDEKLALFR